MRWLDMVRNWGSTETERREVFPCDALLPNATDALFRAVSVAAPASTVFRWLCQLKAAPYSYDWIDNFGRRSPRELTPGLEHLEIGQRAMTLFEIACFEVDRHLTLRLDAGSLAPPMFVSYCISPDPGGCRLVVKIISETSSPFLNQVFGTLGAAGDWVMMRRQLLNLRDLAERAG